MLCFELGRVFSQSKPYTLTAGVDLGGWGGVGEIGGPLKTPQFNRRKSAFYKLMITKLVII